jgi:hypothetical protein
MRLPYSIIFYNSEVGNLEAIIEIYFMSLFIMVDLGNLLENRIGRIDITLLK